MGRGGKPDKILGRWEAHTRKGEEDFANTGSGTEACMYDITLEVVGEQM